MEVAFNFYHAMFRFAPPGDLFSMFVSSRIPVYAALLVAYHAIRTLGQLLGKPVALRCARVGTYVGIIALVGLTVYATHYSPSLSNAQSVPFLYFQF